MDVGSNQLIFPILVLLFSPGQYEEYGEDFVDMLDGMFSFVLLDTRDKSFIAARDAIGITPLYMGWGLDGMLLHFHDVVTLKHVLRAG